MKNLTIALFFVSTIAFSQVDDYRATLSLTGAISFPVSDFGDNRFNNKNSGLAKPSFLSGFDLTYARTLGSTPYGFAATVRAIRYPFDNDAIEHVLESEIGDNWTAYADTWDVLSFYVGGYSSRKLSERLSFKSKLMIGIASIGHPTIEAYIFDVGSTLQMTSVGTSGTGFSYLIGSGLSFKTSDRWTIMFDVDYYNTKSSHKITTTGSIDGVIIDRLEDEYDQPVSAVSLQFGIGFRMK